MTSSLLWLHDKYKCISSQYVSRNKHKVNSLFPPSNLKKKEGKSICYNDVQGSTSFPSYSAHQFPQYGISPLCHLRIPSLSVGSGYYQRAAHAPVGLLLSPTQLSCFAHLLICTWLLYLLQRLASSSQTTRGSAAFSLRRPRNIQWTVWICACAA